MVDLELKTPVNPAEMYSALCSSSGVVGWSSPALAIWVQGGSPGGVRGKAPRGENFGYFKLKIVVFQLELLESR